MSLLLIPSLGMSQSSSGRHFVPSIQQQKAEAQAKGEVPSFTNESISKSQTQPPASDKQVYSRLQKTCNYWTTVYKRSRSERARVFMNSSCKGVSEFARSKLGLKQKSNYVAYKPKRKPVGGTVIGINQKAEEKSTYCKSLVRQREKIQK